MVFVISKNGQPLMPIRRHGKVRRLLKLGRAKVVQREPFTIKLLFDTKNEVSELKLGVDTGSKKVGIAVVDQNGVVLYASEVQTRDQEVTKKMTRRRELRRNRRSRKCRYRKPRFDNRKNSKRKDRYSPTLISKKDTHTREIEFIRSILPIKKENIVIEYTNFDTHKITNPNVYGWQYQRGPQYQYESIRQAVLDRDNYQCQKCKARNTELHVHHIVPRSKGGNDGLKNLITLCKDCHNSLHKGLWTLNIKGKRGSKTRSATQIDTICSMLRKEYPEAQETYGYITSINRHELGLPKTHWIDAVVIASGGREVELPVQVYCKRVE
jgi:5-methylcytosine-specific restriction endonuclease McrA